MIFYVIYLLFTPILWVIILLATIFNHKVRTNYFSFSKQLYFIKNYIAEHNHNKKPCLLFHAASAGEYEQIKPILRLIDRNQYFIVQSFTSPTIYNQEKESSLCDIACYHPFDFFWLSLQFFIAIKPTKYIITRHDVWPGHIVIAKTLKISVYYINANIHKHSIWIKPYIKPFSTYFLNRLDKIIVPSDIIANHLYNLNISKKKIFICTDSRFAQILYRKTQNQNRKLLPDVFLNNTTIVFGSIDEKDENIIFQSLKTCYPLGSVDLVQKKHYLVFVPHEINPKSLNMITTHLTELSIEYAKYSQYSQATNHYNVLLIDDIGLLADLYKYSNKAYIGGGFSRGVHSVLEPAIYNTNIAYGPNIEMLDEAKIFIDQNHATLIHNVTDMNNFLLSEESSDNHLNDLFQDNTQEIWEHIQS